MGTPGVALNIERDLLELAIRKHRGRMVHIAKSFNCVQRAIKKQIARYPDLEELVKDLRNDRDEFMLEDAEDTLQDAMNARGEDMSNALKSAFFILNNKGRERGYNPPNNQAIEILNLVELKKQIESGESLQK